MTGAREPDDPLDAQRSVKPAPLAPLVLLGFACAWIAALVVVPALTARAAERFSDTGIVAPLPFSFVLAFGEGLGRLAGRAAALLLLGLALLPYVALGARGRAAMASYAFAALLPLSLLLAGYTALAVDPFMGDVCTPFPCSTLHWAYVAGATAPWGWVAIAAMAVWVRHGVLGAKAPAGSAAVEAARVAAVTSPPALLAGAVAAAAAASGGWPGPPTLLVSPPFAYAASAAAGVALAMLYLRGRLAPAVRVLRGV